MPFILMILRIFADKITMGRAAANQAAIRIAEAIACRGSARILAATGGSQFEFLDALTQIAWLDWTKVEMFHLDEYVGLSIDDPASFRKYLLERLINKTGIRKFHLLNGEIDPQATCTKVGRLLTTSPVDVAFAGIGENGHLAFNDPPADFGIEAPYHVVQLDKACRRQQVGEGWFKRIEDVPDHAISVTVRQLLKAQTIITVVPHARKAQAVQACLEGPVSPLAPASILRNHPDVTLYLDRDSASMLSAPTIALTS